MAEAIYNGIDNLDLMAELAPNYNRFLARLVEKHLHDEKQLVDFGAGTGTFAEMLNARGFRVACVEPDERLHHHLRQKTLPAHRTLDTIPQDSLPAVFTFNVLEHIEDDAAALRQIHTRL